MSKSPTRPSQRKSDRTAAVTLEVPTGVADDIEALLRDYAEEAELDTSLVVDHSGFLIAGISSLPDVDVDRIGALVAGASVATEGLTGALGEEGCVESLHLGEDRLLYLKEVGERFILVGVSDSNIPAGILRDQASLIEPTLSKLLEKVKAVPMSLTKNKAEFRPAEPEPKPAPARSLRQSAQMPETVPPAKPEPAAPNKQARPVGARVSNPEPVNTGKISGTIGAQPGANTAGSMIPGEPAQNVESGFVPSSTPVPSSAPVPSSTPVSSSAPARFSAPAPSSESAPSSTPAPSSEPPEKEPIPGDIFEIDEPAQPKQEEENKTPKPVAQKRVEPRAIVENSPFEMDEDDEDDTNFKPVRPNTTPVHLSVPAARQREAAARKENEDDDEQQSGPRYSFELG